MKSITLALVGLFLPLASHAADNFEDATAISFLAAQPTLIVTGNTTGATAQVGEPDHNGLPATRSFWYALTVDEARRVEIIGTPTSPNNVVLALYTGDSLETLTPVSRYADLFVSASSKSLDADSEPFNQNALIHFDAVPDTTYYLAVDSEGTSQGAFSLALSTSRNPITAKLELIPARAEWSFYQALNGTTTFDPSTTDEDFYTTWHTAAAYDGPTFSEPQATPIGYGAIAAEPTRAAGSTLVTPASGSRQAVTYYRTTFTPAQAVQELGFEGLLDDGVIIYINGTEIARMNVADTTDPDSSIATARGATFVAATGNLDTERLIQYAIASDLDLPAGQEVEIAVSSHNAGPTSSDSNFHLRVYATQVTEIFDLQLTFKSASIAGNYELTWQAQQGFSYRVEFSTTGLDTDDWQNEVQGTQTATSDGPLNRFVISNADTTFWRVIRIPPGDGN